MGKPTFVYSPEIDVHDRTQERLSGLRSLSFRDAKRETLIKALAVYGTDTRGKQAAAAALGVCLKTLYNLLHEYGLWERYRCGRGVR